MKHFSSMIAVALVVPVFSAAETPAKDAHPDLSGIWSYTVGLPPNGVRKVVDGASKYENFDRGVIRKAAVAGALPSTPAPSYKAEFQAKVRNLSEHENKLDPVFYCGRPGVPRVGTPRRIVQLKDEVIFFYEDMAGDPYRIIPVLSGPNDNRKHRVNGNPTAYGDSIAHWEGNTLVVDVVNFVDDSWFGEEGYFHSDAMHVTERLWRDGENIAYQMTVDDPKVLAAPWTQAAKLVKPSTEALDESPRCVEDDGSRLLNNDHHGQR